MTLVHCKTPLAHCNNTSDESELKINQTYFQYKYITNYIIKVKNIFYRNNAMKFIFAFTNKNWYSLT